MSVLACVARCLSTAPLAIVAALSHSQLRLPLHYRGKCHRRLVCRSYRNNLLVMASGPRDHTTNAAFCYAALILGDVCFPLFSRAASAWSEVRHQIDGWWEFWRTLFRDGDAAGSGPQARQTIPSVFQHVRRQQSFKTTQQ